MLSARLHCNSMNKRVLWCRRVRTPHPIYLDMQPQEHLQVATQKLTGTLQAIRKSLATSVVLDLIRIRPGRILLFTDTKLIYMRDTQTARLRWSMDLEHLARVRFHAPLRTSVQ